MNSIELQDHIKSEIEKRKDSPITRLETFSSINSDFIKFQKADLIYYRIDNRKLFKSTYITEKQFNFFKYRYQKKENPALTDNRKAFFNELLELAQSRLKESSSQFIENVLSISITERKLFSSFVIDEYITGEGYITDGDLKFIIQGLIR